ncbi:MAG TPA: aminotransferase class IV [Planctomycetota bacterium]|nr:aminotransferase class IV [Planctomycetota bacterium]
MKSVDGELLADDAVPPLPADLVAPFETMAASGSAVPLWPRHLQRLRAAAQRLGLPWAPPPRLERAAAELLAANHHHGGVVRLQLVPAAAAVHWQLTTRARGTAVAPLRLIPCVARRPAAAPPADLKTAPRNFYDAVLAEARAGGADDGIVLGDDGTLLETANANLWLLLDGAWVTPPLDGRVLPGIARELLLLAARAAGVPVAERTCNLADLHRAPQVAVSNAVHGPRGALLVGAPPAVPDTVLARLWRSCMPG